MLSLNDEPRVPNLVSAALSLMGDNAHIIGLYAMPAVVPPQEIIGAGDRSWLDEQLRAFEEQAGRVKNKFEGLFKDRPATHEWRFDNSSFDATVADSVIEHGRAADLIVTSRASRNGWIDDVAERAAIESGRPVIVLPEEGDLLSIGTEITIAWKSSKEAARAVFDALPLLRKARHVRLLTVVEDGIDADRASRAQLVASLSRHGVEAEIESIPKIGLSPGDALLDYAKRRNQNLLVMGLYGHSRFREFFLGGASRDVLSDVSVPVLLSH
ncbi:UspA domain-containing protein [Hyphomicrobium denitrificans 1NES1]|uniref:UspA domain-containing protein n=1 Tax=Hyphomicrobium denitrificans 1NES1 TaxID=670307 RepID=N0B1I5_9HYPH|nr:UspA domain-containing protein [Hyphomicrobium denitrificans 1NES1]